jgi:glycosyltransferase involved in cell wall biosynthesis
MRVMQVLHQGGGAGSVYSTLHLSAGLAARGVVVKFVCPPHSPVEAAAREAGLEVLPLKLEPGQHHQNALLLGGLMDRHPVDLINSQSSRDRTALTWLGLRRRLKLPVVFTRRQMPRTFFLENWVASRVATRVIAVSRAVADALERRGTPRGRVADIHNGLIESRVDATVSEARVESWRQRIEWEPSRRTIGIISRLKDQAVVLRSLSQVELPVRLVLAGVSREGELARLAENVPVRHAVVFVPFEPDIRPLYAVLDMVLLPSRMEGLSQALLEAMALEKPVIASAAAGNLDLITDRMNGVLVEPLDPARWAEAINLLLGDPREALTLAAAARHTARIEFSIERTVNSTLTLFQEITGMHGA